MSPGTAVRKDSDDVQAALRLGWVVAEVRGRHRLLPEAPPGVTASIAARTDNALPLNAERTPKELAVQAEAVLLGLATRLKLPADTAGLSYLRQGAAATVAEELHALCEALRDARDEEERRPAWHRLSVFLYAWDARTQDELAASSSVLGAGYNLGRAVAETYWALDPGADDGDMRSWSFLFGERRRELVALLLRRLLSYLDPLTAPAITASLQAWSDVAADGARRSSPDTMPALYRQSLLWRDLLVGEIPAAGLVPTEGSIAAAALRPVLWAFRFQLLGLVAAAVVLAVGVGLLAGSGGHPFAAVLTVLGVFGVTTAGLAVRVKDYAHGLMAQIRLARDARLVKEAATILPPRITPNG